MAAIRGCPILYQMCTYSFRLVPSTARLERGLVGGQCPECGRRRGHASGSPERQRLRPRDPSPLRAQAKDQERGALYRVYWPTSARSQRARYVVDCWSLPSPAHGSVRGQRPACLRLPYLPGIATHEELYGTQHKNRYYFGPGEGKPVPKED